MTNYLRIEPRESSQPRVSRRSEHLMHNDLLNDFNERKIRRLHLRKHTRGAAYAEAVVIIPVFIVLFVGILYVRKAMLAKQAVEQQARTCAWLYSANNCEKEGIPDSCKSHLNDDQLTSNAVDQITEGLGKLTGGTVASVVHTILDPVLGAAFGNKTEATISGTVSGAPLLGINPGTTQSKYGLACNIKPSDPMSITEELWDAIGP